MMNAWQKKVVLDEIGDNIRELEEKTIRFSNYLENLAKRIEAIEDKTKAEEFSQSLLYLSDCFLKLANKIKK